MFTPVFDFFDQYSYDNGIISYGDQSIIRIINNHPVMLVNPGSVNEIRVELMTDINTPPEQGTLTIQNTGGASSIYQTDYTYEAIGRIKTINENRKGTSSENSYMYNNVGKLIEATTDGVTQTWQYDANGNRTHEDGVEVATYDAQDRLTRYKDNTYDYNALGS